MCSRLPILLLVAALGASTTLAQTNLVRNGDFSQVTATGALDSWAAAGAADIKQELARDVGPDGRGFSAKLTCTDFRVGGPANHVMICQVGTVSVQRGKWYRLSFQAKGEGIRGGVKVGLSNMRPWGSAGLSGNLNPRATWKPYEFVFRATMDLPPENSRLQIWYYSIGTLWLANVALSETEVRPARHPQLVTEGRTNFLPNSSFECGGAGWGSYAPDLAVHWTGNVFALMGEVDASTAAHGSHSLRITLDATQTPTYYFDYYEPVRKQMTSLIVAHEGWLHAQPGQTYTLSASLRADEPGRVGLFFVRQADGRSLRQNLTLTDQWQRYTFNFIAQSEFLWTGVGLDLAATKAPAATVWVDAIQLEQAPAATPYQPALPLEVMAETTAPGNAFPADADRVAVSLRLAAFNNTAAPATTTVSLAATDYFDAEALRRSVSLKVPPQAAVSSGVDLPVNKLGFFRVTVAPPNQPPQHLRCMTFLPYRDPDSRFGMNHAYPWDWMLPLAHQAGLRWWRDWTTQWNTVQPQRDAAFSFREVDFQVDRVRQQRGRVLALFPFPSAEWSSSADEATVAKLNPKPWQRKQILTAFKPTDDVAFSRFISESVKHLGDRLEWFQFLNEALYTHYALPAGAGYTMDDYLHLLRLTHAALKAARPQAKLLAGLGIWADSKYTRDFVEAGGLQFADALDLHLYPSGEPETYGESLGALWRRMKERGEARPIWVTELGCYADDDPAITPFAASFGDEAMRNALKGSEREAAEWLIKFATLVFANGGEKIFLHAGTCGEINGDATGGVWFKYGGVPRKILPAISVMANLLPPSARFERTESLGDQVTAYWFAAAGQRVGVAWSADGEEHPLRLPAGVKVLDLMGNPCAATRADGTPAYLVR